MGEGDAQPSGLCKWHQQGAPTMQIDLSSINPV